MRRDARTIGAFALIYLMLGGVGLAGLFALGGLSDLMFSLALVLAIALIPLSAILVTLRQRAVAPSAPARDAAPSSPPIRDLFDFTFAAWNGIDSPAAIARLSQHLDRLEIVHRHQRGAIDVSEPDLRWHVAPVTGQLRVAGWVEADDAAQRAMVAAAVAEFLREELGIQLERVAA